MRCRDISSFWMWAKVVIFVRSDWKRSCHGGVPIAKVVLSFKQSIYVTNRYHNSQMSKPKVSFKLMKCIFLYFLCATLYLYFVNFIQANSKSDMNLGEGYEYNFFAAVMNNPIDKLKSTVPKNYIYKLVRILVISFWQLTSKTNSYGHIS